MPFHLLIVDNNNEVRQNILDQLPVGDDLRVACADTTDAAYQQIGSRYFDLALVDLKLLEDFNSGIDVLQALRELAPTCERLAMTRHTNREPSNIMRLMDSSGDPLVHGLISKQAAFETDDFFEAHVVRPRLDRYRAAAVQFSGLDAVGDALSRSKRIWRSSARTDDAKRRELRSVLQRIFGGRVAGLGTADGPEMHLAMVEQQGLSGAVAFTAVPVLQNGDEGTRTFVKVGPRERIMDEVTRFKNVVQLNTPLKFRVELLGEAFGDNIGAVAYSFAGVPNGPVNTLDKIASSEAIDSPRIHSTINNLFNAESKRWYEMEGPPKTLGSYFQSELRSLLVDRHPVLVAACKNMAAEYGAQFDEQACTLRLGAVVLDVPNQRNYGRAPAGTKRETCMSHGDLHGGNILLAREPETEQDQQQQDTIYLIDFAHAGFAPRATDAAVLQGSIRLWNSDVLRVPDPFSNLASMIAVEAQLARRWMNKNERPPGAKHRWAGTARLLDDRLRTNFATLSGEEVLWTYLLQASRLASMPALDHAATLRLFAWHTGISRALGLKPE